MPCGSGLLTEVFLSCFLGTTGASRSLLKNLSTHIELHFKSHSLPDNPKCHLKEPREESQSRQKLEGLRALRRRPSRLVVRRLACRCVCSVVIMFPRLNLTSFFPQPVIARTPNLVPCRSYPPLSQATHAAQCPYRRQGSSVHLCHPRIFDRRSPRARRYAVLHVCVSDSLTHLVPPISFPLMFFRYLHMKAMPPRTCA